MILFICDFYLPVTLTSKIILLFLFRPSPDGLVFKLTFAAPLGEYLQKNITGIIEYNAPHETQGNYELLDIGDLR